MTTNNMTLSQGYRQAQAAKCKQPCLDYPYLGIQDEDDKDILERMQY